MTYRCLILDHDDTAVRSTPEIHYPAHLEVMRQLRPDSPPASLEEWLLKNFSPGIMAYMTEELGFSSEEVDLEYKIWREHTEKQIPSFFPGFLETLEEFRSRGGIITVVSHSEADLIRRDYEAAGAGHLPQAVYGWEFDESKRKPHPWPVEQILSRYGLSPREALILDDLKPAVEMSRRSGVPIAAAGWGYDIPPIRRYMEEHCLAYFSAVEEFRRFLLN